MTEAELKTILQTKEGGPTLIMGEGMKDVAFWPLSLEITDKTYNLSGIWYSNVFEDLMGDAFGNPLRETIKIKKEDLAKWSEKPAKTELT